MHETLLEPAVSEPVEALQIAPLVQDVVTERRPLYTIEKSDGTVRIGSRGRITPGLLKLLDTSEPEYMQSNQKLRESLLEDYKEETVHYPEIEAYFKELGLEPKPYLVLGHESYDAARRRINKEDEGNLSGTYFQSIGISLIRKDHFIDGEWIEFPKVTEGNVVHELAHSTTDTGTPQWHIRESEVPGTYNSLYHQNARSGHSILAYDNSSQANGEVFEEMFAEQTASDYLEMKYGKKHMFGSFDGNLGEGVTVTVKDNDAAFAENGTIILPSRYVHIQGTKYVISTSAIVARAGDFIREAFPDFKDAQIAARTDPDGLREVIKSVRSIERGLYVKLRSLPYTAKGFEEAYRLVANALGRK